MNEGVVRSPKWMRNFADFEINTGDDIKGKPSKRKQKKIDAEKERKRQEEQAREQERREQIAAEEEEKAKQKQKETDELFSELFDSVMSYIFHQYKKCYIYVEKDNYLTIEKDDLLYKNINFEFKVTLNNTQNIPTFNVSITYGEKVLNYVVSGAVYVQLRNHISNDVYQYYKMGYAKKKGSSSSKSNYGKSNYGKSNYGKSNYGKSNYGKSNYGSSKSSKGESEEVKNKRRRYILLLSTLDGYRREYEKLINSKASQRDIDIVKNQINTTQNKIDILKKKYKFESINFLKHLKPFYS